MSTMGTIGLGQQMYAGVETPYTKVLRSLDEKQGG